MTQVAVNVNGRMYRLRCAAGQEDRLVDLASFVKGKLDGLFAEHGNVGDERVMLMAAIMIADELFDVRAELEREKSARAFAEELAEEAAEKSRQDAMRQAEAIALVGDRMVGPARKGVA